MYPKITHEDVRFLHMGDEDYFNYRQILESFFIASIPDIGIHSIGFFSTRSYGLG